MLTLKLVECTDHRVDYGVLIVKNEKITANDIQCKICEFKNSYKAYGYASIDEMKEDGFETMDELLCCGSAAWCIDDLIELAFPESWGVSFLTFDNIVEC